MPSVYNYRHVELDNVGRGKRVIQPPGGQTADIFGQRTDPSYSSASSQAGSDVASSRITIETDQQSIGAQQSIIDGVVPKQAVAANGGQASPTGSIASSASATAAQQQQQQQASVGQQQLLRTDDFKPTTTTNSSASSVASSQEVRQASAQLQANQVNRTPKKTIPVLRRNPITGEIIADPTDRPAVVRVRQPPGGRSSGIF